MDILEPANRPYLERHKLVIENETEYIPSSFRFLEAQKGLRPGKIHLFIGSSGSGKSTFTRALISSIAKGHKVLVWLSEESTDDFIMALTKAEISEEILENIKIISENPNPGPKELVIYQMRMEELITQYNPDVVFFDNITTCERYSELNPFGGQSGFVSWLKGLTFKRKFALFVVAHTSSAIKENQGRLRMRSILTLKVFILALLVLPRPAR
jgi:energy-coupling factor transporter ATP-binding protein EcfA2